VVWPALAPRLLTTSSPCWSATNARIHCVLAHCSYALQPPAWCRALSSGGHTCLSGPTSGTRAQSYFYLTINFNRRAWVHIAAATLSGNSLRQTVHTHRASVYQAAKLVAALLRVAGVNAGLAESKGRLLPCLWLTSPAGWLSRTRISSGTLLSVIEYGTMGYLFINFNNWMQDYSLVRQCLVSDLCLYFTFQSLQ